MEKLFRKNRHLEDPQDVVTNLQMVTVGKRVNHWMNTNPVGSAFMRFSEAAQTGVLKNLHVIRYEDLTSDPASTMRKLYEYLKEPAFNHDFDHVAQVTREDDSQYLFYGNHSIREKIEPVPLDYNEVLGQGLCESIKKNNSMFFKIFYPELT